MAQMVKVNLNYVTPDQSFAYPLYTEDGLKLFDDHTILSSETITRTIGQYGSYIYYLASDEKTSQVDIKMQSAYEHSRVIIDEIVHSEALSKETFRKAEILVEDLISDLQYSEIKAINLLHIVKTVDDYLFQHLINVGILSAYLAHHNFSFSQEEIKFISLGGYLIDIGMMKLDRQLLKKQGKYDVSEKQKIRRHPQLSYELLKGIKGIHPIVLQTVLFHHEQYDGNGYFHLPYEDLPLPPKIVAICDTFDAYTSNRPYRDALEPSAALKNIFNSLYTVFDHKIVSAFINTLAKRLNNSQMFYGKNDFCELSTNEIAMIKNYSSDVLKPRVVVFGRFNKYSDRVEMKFYSRPIEIDLQKDNERVLVRLISESKKAASLKEHLTKKRLLEKLF